MTTQLGPEIVREALQADLTAIVDQRRYSHALRGTGCVAVVVLDGLGGIGVRSWIVGQELQEKKVAVALTKP